jgi:hypothetical protein
VETCQQIDANCNWEISQIEFIKALRQDQALAKRLRLPNHIRQEHENRKLFARNYADIDKDQDNVFASRVSGLLSHIIHCHGADESSLPTVTHAWEFVAYSHTQYVMHSCMTPTHPSLLI